jgi:hypothetical protein
MTNVVIAAGAFGGEVIAVLRDVGEVSGFSSGVDGVQVGVACE